MNSFIIDVAIYCRLVFAKIDKLRQKAFACSTIFCRVGFTNRRVWGGFFVQKEIILLSLFSIWVSSGGETRIFAEYKYTYGPCS